MAQGDKVPQYLEDLAQPHVDSFDYFLGEGLAHVVAALEGVEVAHPSTGLVHRFWFENAAIGRPVKDDAGSAAAAADQRLFPRECREAVSLSRRIAGHLRPTPNRRPRASL